RVIGKLVKTNGPLKQNPPALIVKKIIEKPAKTQSHVSASDDTSPETEKFFPFSPLDFESSDLPEEHQTAHLPLNGVPLLSLSEESVVDKLPYLDPLRL
ncbi:Securin (Fragment), partial [Lemmus lemmus]